MNVFANKYTIPIINNQITVYRIFFQSFWKFSALLGLIKILNHWMISNINITSQIIDKARVIILYSIGMFLSARIHVQISHKVCAFATKTSFCFQYIASTMLFAQIIINIDIAHRQIIPMAVFWFDQSVFVIKLILLPTNTINMIANAK